MVFLSTGFQNAMAVPVGGGAPPAQARSSAPAVASASAVDQYYDEADEEEDDPLAWNPKKIMTQWTNEDGIKCVTIVVQLSGGADLTDSNDVEVHVSTQGDELAITEVWSPLIADMRNYYSTFPKLKSESEENSLRKSIAMIDTCDALAGGIPKTSTYKMSLPFRVDPTVKTVRLVGTDDGQRFAAVDLAERSTMEVETFKLLSAKTATNSGKKKKIVNNVFSN
jgi:hypothetical protein